MPAVSTAFDFCADLRSAPLLVVLAHVFPVVSNANGGNVARPAAQIVESLVARRVRIQPSLVYAVTNAGRKPKLNGYASLVKAKRLADAMGGIDKAREALEVLAKLM